MPDIDRYGLTAARHHGLDKAPKPNVTTIDIHAHLHIQKAHEIADPHQDLSQQSFFKYSTGLTGQTGFAEWKLISYRPF